MSRVFVAEEAALRRKVVVKVLLPELAAGISAERFRREVLVAASLQQANIVPLHAAGETGGLPYYTMPFVEGESLRARLSEKGALPVAEAVSILRDVAKALAYSHERGIVHRDIKPDNVLLSGGTAVVTDFGIAKAIVASLTEGGADSLTQTGLSLGTPAYMAPEQAAGEEVDHRADLYSLGLLGYEMLTGRHPFASRTSARQMIGAQLGERPTPVHEIRAEVPRALSAVITACLEKDPALRPQSARDRKARLGARIPGTPPWNGFAAYAYAVAGDRASASRILRDLQALHPQPWLTETAIAETQLALGDTSAAFEALDRATAAHEMWTPFLNLNDPMFDIARKSARFAALARRVGLDPNTFTTSVLRKP